VESALASVSSPNFGIQPQDFNSADPDQLGNDPKLEQQWATTAGKHAETYEKLLLNIKDKTKLRLTPVDDSIYSHFRSNFPHLEISQLTDEMLKNPSAKSLWNLFCMHYKDHSLIKDYNFACLLRLNSEGTYEQQENVTIVPKIQFLAIEIARNKEGKNNKIQGQSSSSSTSTIIRTSQR